MRHRSLGNSGINASVIAFIARLFGNSSVIRVMASGSSPQFDIMKRTVASEKSVPNGTVKTRVAPCVGSTFGMVHQFRLGCRDRVGISDIEPQALMHQTVATSFGNGAIPKDIGRKYVGWRVDNEAFG